MKAGIRTRIDAPEGKNEGIETELEALKRELEGEMSSIEGAALMKMAT